MRQLVTIRTVSELIPIEGADFIELAKVDGWQCIVKKGEFKVGDPGLYFEIDSMIPSDDERFAFLSRGQVRTHYRIKTMRMRKVLSQGLLMPMSILTDTDQARLDYRTLDGGPRESLTDIFQIHKYEPSLPIAGQQKGTFPSHLVPKTDQERIQNLTKILKNGFFYTHVWEVTEKLDGTSCTMFYHAEQPETESDVPPEMVDARVGVCSRNWEMQTGEEGSVYSRMFDQLDMDSKLRKLSRNIAIQGEIIGPSIQGNKYKLDKQTFFVFDIYNIDQRSYLTCGDRELMCKKLGLEQVPFVMLGESMDPDLDKLLELAQGHSALHKTQREGLVFKSVTREQDGSVFSFKVISNKFLLKHE